MSFYGGLQSTAQGLLTDKGQAMLLRQRAAGTYDPATGAATVTATDVAVIGAVFDFPAEQIDGTNIERGDKKVLIGAKGLAARPNVDDQLVIGGVVHAVIQAKPLAPAGTVVLWTLQVRK